MTPMAKVLNNGSRQEVQSPFIEPLQKKTTASHASASNVGTALLTVMLSGGPVHVLDCKDFIALSLSSCRTETRRRSRTSGPTQPTEGHKAHGRHFGAKQSESMLLGQKGRLPGAGHTIVLSFSSTYWNREFTLLPSNEDKHLALSKQGQTWWLLSEPVGVA